MVCCTNFMVFSTGFPPVVGFLFCFFYLDFLEVLPSALAFWLGSLHGGDGATHFVVYQTICYSHGSREITNPLSPRFHLSPPLQSRHEIEDFVLLWHVLYVEHQETEFLDVVLHRFGVSEPFQCFPSHPSSVGGKDWSFNSFFRVSQVVI